MTIARREAATVTPMALAGIALALAFGIWQVAVAWAYWQHLALFAGVDFRILTQAAGRWLDGQGLYHAYQLAGPYDIRTVNVTDQGPIMYPPTMLLLLVPFTVLPAVLWWIAPLGIITYVVWRQKPRVEVWPVLALLAVFPTTLNVIATGNPDMWSAAALALATLYGWPAVLLLLKPTIAPLALLWGRRRSWWIALVGLALVSALFLPMWPDYLTVLSNTKTGLGAAYSLNHLPLLFVPLVAWLGSDRVAEARRADRTGRCDT